MTPTNIFKRIAIVTRHQITGGEYANDGALKDPNILSVAKKCNEWNNSMSDVAGIAYTIAENKETQERHVFIWPRSPHAAFHKDARAGLLGRDLKLIHEGRFSYDQRSMRSLGMSTLNGRFSENMLREIEKINFYVDILVYII